MTRDELRNMMAGGIVDNLIQTFIAAKLTPDAMTKLFQQVQAEVAALDPYKVGAALSRIATAWNKG